MPFGDLKGTLTGSGPNIGSTNALTGSVAVAVGDFVFVTFGQQTALTATGVTDNLGNSYSAQNAGTDAGTVTGISFYSRVTVAGTLTTVTVAATSSANDYCGEVVVLLGPVAVSPIDTNSANITTQITSPMTCPSTGTLAQARELIVCWGVTDNSAAWSATSPNLLGGQANNSNNIKCVIGYQSVSVTTAVAPVFTCGTAPDPSVVGTCSFKASLDPDISHRGICLSA